MMLTFTQINKMLLILQNYQVYIVTIALTSFDLVKKESGKV